MSYLKYSLAEDGDNLSPFEKQLRSRFLTNENKNLVFKSAQTSVDAFITYGNVVDAMYETFTNNLHSNPSTVDELNTFCINEMKKKKNLCQQGTLRSRNNFIRASIPSNFLPRPSFSLQDEESYDKILEFPRF